MPKNIPTFLRLAAGYCVIPLLLSGLAAPSISWGQSSSVEKEIELEFWRAIKDSNDPTMVNAYLQKYPDGDFAILANVKINKLEEAVVLAESAGASDSSSPTTDLITGCPAGTKQTYKGCEADSGALAAAAEAALKAVELSQSANTAEEKAAAKAAAEHAAQQLQVMKAAADVKKAERKAALKVRAKADNKKALAVVVEVHKVRVGAAAGVADAKKKLARATTREEKNAARQLVEAAESLADVTNLSDITAAKEMLSTAQETLETVVKVVAERVAEKKRVKIATAAAKPEARRKGNVPAKETRKEVADSGGDSGGGGGGSSSSTTATQSNSGGGNSGAEAAAARARAIATAQVVTRIRQHYASRGLVNSSMMRNDIKMATTGIGCTGAPSRC